MKYQQSKKSECEGVKCVTVFIIFDYFLLNFAFTRFRLLKLHGSFDELDIHYFVNCDCCGHGCRKSFWSRANLREAHGPPTTLLVIFYSGIFMEIPITQTDLAADSFQLTCFGEFLCISAKED